jgi:hypothetical protein
VAGALNSRERGLVGLQREGEPIWVNPANVLYAEEVGEGSGYIA